MHELLLNKSVIFFDVGNTLVYPASGDWMITNKFLELAGERLKQSAPEQLRQAWRAGIEYLLQHHQLREEAEEIEQFTRFYTILSDALKLDLTPDELHAAAWDRTCNMDNYLLYPDARKVVETLSRTHRLGLISDTWPSIERMLLTLDVRQFFSCATYSYELGVFKPDRRIFLNALQKCGYDAKQTVFIDDNPQNLAGASELGITPILIAADPGPEPETPFQTIHTLSELL